MSVSIRIFDTTLREGYAENGSAVSIEEAVRIARALEEAGVSTIEAGSPAYSQSQRDITKAVAAAVSASEVAALASCDVSEVAAAMEAVREARKPVVHVYISAHEANQAGARTRVCRAIRQAVSMVRAAGMTAQFSIAHIADMERPFRRQCIDVAVHAGATRIGVPDSNGNVPATEYVALVRDIVRFVGPRVVVSAHCHNASGHAVENAMAAIEAGAQQVETTVHGIGPSGGNAALEEVARRIRARFGNTPVSVNPIAAIEVGGDAPDTRDSGRVQTFDERPTQAIASPDTSRDWRCRVEVAAL